MLKKLSIFISLWNMQLYLTLSIARHICIAYVAVCASNHQRVINCHQKFPKDHHNLFYSVNLQSFPNS